MSGSCEKEMRIMNNKLSIIKYAPLLIFIFDNGNSLFCRLKKKKKQIFLFACILKNIFTINFQEKMKYVYSSNYLNYHIKVIIIEL